MCYIVCKECVSLYISSRFRLDSFKVLSYLHSQVHHPQDTVFGMDEQAPAVWMKLQHVDGDAAEVTLINLLPRDNTKHFKLE